MDAKPLKVIIYAASQSARKFEKSKEAAWYPAGNEGDTYNVEYDTNWKKLQSLVQECGLKILNNIKNVKVVGERPSFE